MKTKWKNEIDLSRWHKWFAWYPVRISAYIPYSYEDTTPVKHYRWVWLGYVKRKLTRQYAYGGSILVADYKAVAVD